MVLKINVLHKYSYFPVDPFAIHKGDEAAILSKNSKYCKLKTTVCVLIDTTVLFIFKLQELRRTVENTVRVLI